MEYLLSWESGRICDVHLLVQYICKQNKIQTESSIKKDLVWDVNVAVHSHIQIHTGLVKNLNNLQLLLDYRMRSMDLKVMY